MSQLSDVFVTAPSLRRRRRRRRHALRRFAPPAVERAAAMERGPDEPGELLELHWLGGELVHTGLPGPLPVLQHRVRRKRDDWRAATRRCALAPPYLARRLVAVEHR